MKKMMMKMNYLKFLKKKSDKEETKQVEEQNQESKAEEV